MYIQYNEIIYKMMFRKKKQHLAHKYDRIDQEIIMKTFSTLTLKLITVVVKHQ